MVYNICFMPKQKGKNSYKQYQENNTVSILKTLQCKLIHVTTLKRVHLVYLMNFAHKLYQSVIFQRKELILVIC